MFLGNYSDHLSQLHDRHHGKLLEDIPNFLERIRSLITRNKLKIQDMQDYAKIMGSLDFLEGLEYHYNNFLSHLHMLAAKAVLGDDRMLDHEAVAYLNRLGQFYYFAKSLELLQVCPKIQELYLFRRKSVGHRSIDVPYKDEDSPHEQIWQAGCFLRRSFSGTVPPNFDPEKDLHKDMEIFLTPEKYLSDKAFISYEIISNNAYAIFIPQKDHPFILKELEDAYIHLFATRK